MNVPMSLEFSSDALADFLDYMADKGLANKNTIQSRKAACAKMLEILDTSESSDLREVDIDEVAMRFANLKGTNYSPQSLQVYKSRVNSSLQDFLRYKQNPANFKPSASSGGKGKSTPSGKVRVRKRPEVVVPRPSVNHQNEQKEAGLSGASTINIPVALRVDCVMQLNGLPTDLTPAEADKISAVVKAMAMG